MVLPEIFCGSRRNIGKELHFDTASRDVADGYVEEYYRIFRVWRPLVPLHRHSAAGYRRHEWDYLLLFSGSIGGLKGVLSLTVRLKFPI